MTYADQAGKLVEIAFILTDRQWTGLCSSWKELLFGLDLGDDPNARVEFFLAVLAAAEGQDPPSALRVMIHDVVRRLDNQTGPDLYRSLRRYEAAMDNWRDVSARLPLPPLEFPQESLGIAFVDGADLLRKPEMTVHGTYNLVVIGVIGSVILKGAIEVRRMWEASK